jgi:D-alanine-D-alanine ligase
MKNKINLGILFGGRSCEHEVSVTSATSILKAIDRQKYNVHLIGIDKSGHWQLGKDIDSITHDGAVAELGHGQSNGLPDPAARPISTPLSTPVSTPVSMGLHNNGNLTHGTTNDTVPESNSPLSLPSLDVIFPVLHGTFGEDGTLQGVLEMAGVPYVGCGVAASALAMDKALAKMVFESAGIPQAPYLVATAFQWNNSNQEILDNIEQSLGYAVFVKPANLGSSVGVGKAKNRKDLLAAINHALEFDNKIVIEQSMENCHEIECAVLGNQNPEPSILGEIIPGDEFYSYETKYIDDKSQLVIPAPIDEETTTSVQQMAVEAFRAVDGSGLSRVDFFVHKETMEITLNEVNTLPGFTPISMYPQLWAASGLAYPDLIDRLIELAIEQHQSKQSLRRSFS